MTGAIGGVGGIGGMGGMGGVGGMTAGAAAPASAPAGGGDTASAAQPSTQVTISLGGQQALAGESTQPGASFSVSQDASGHHYVGGVDANGFSNPDAAHGVSGMDGRCNAFGQDVSQLNKLDELTAALLLALLLKKRD
jgi:hypothetical protein